MRRRKSRRVGGGGSGGGGGGGGENDNNDSSNDDDDDDDDDEEDNDDVVDVDDDHDGPNLNFSCSCRRVLFYSLSSIVSSGTEVEASASLSAICGSNPGLVISVFVG